MKTYEEVADVIQATAGLLIKPTETQFLFESAAALPPAQNIVEIGSYRGLSSLCLALGARCSDSRLFCFTLWQADDSLAWQRVMEEQKLHPTVIYGDANTVLERITVPNVGLIFIDSGHSYEDCKVQLELACRGAVPDCLVAFHDYAHPNYPGVKQYCDELVAAGNLKDTGKVGCIFYGKLDHLRS